LTDHPSLIVTAASAASKAVEFMRGLAMAEPAYNRETEFALAA
jgi:hypothetical protein